MLDKIIDFKNEFGFWFSLFVFSILGFSAGWWAIEIVRFLQKNYS